MDVGYLIYLDAWRCHMGLLEFFHPENLEEAKTLVYKYPKTKVLAGGTDLILNLRKDEVDCDYIVSIANILELKDIGEYEDRVVIGPMVTFSELMKSQVIKRNFRSLINCSSTMGSPQIRNAATVGGNIMNAGSAADTIPCIISLGGILVIESETGSRKILCEDYFNNYSVEKVRSNEILTSIILPKEGSQSGYYKLGKRNSLAIARISAALNLKINDNKIESIRVCLGAVGRHPFRAVTLEQASLKEEVQWLYSEEALSYLSDAVEKSIGGRKTMPFKREAIKGVFKEALSEAMKASGERG